MKINPNIVPLPRTWNRDPQEAIISKVINFFEQGWFKKINPNTISSTKTNLIRWLTPSYSPLYNNWQIEIDDPCLSKEEGIDKQEIKLIDFLEDKYKMRGHIDDKTTLISQFSGIVIKNLLLNKDGKFYLVDRLFRSTHKDYMQLECGSIWHNLWENISIMQSLLYDLYWEEFHLDSINEKFFYFTTPAFEFNFRSENKSITLVWGFIDTELVAMFDKERKSRFLFGVKIDKLAPKNKSNKSLPAEKEPSLQNTWNWKIKLDKEYLDKMRLLENYLQVDIIELWNCIYISPWKLTRLDIFRKDILNKMLGIESGTTAHKIEDMDISITENSVKIQWKRKDLFYEAFPWFLKKYYWWEIKECSDDCLEIFFSNFSPSYLEGVFNSNENHTKQNKIIRMCKSDILNILGQYQNPTRIKKIGKKWYTMTEDRDDDYLFYVNKERTDINTPWDIIWDLFNELSIPVNVESQHREESDNKFTNISDLFLLNNWYNQIYPWSIVWLKNEYKQIENVFGNVFWKNITYLNNKKIFNTFLPYLLSEIKQRNSRYPRRFFIDSKICSSLWDKRHICCSNFIRNEDFGKFNDFFSDIVAILSPTWQQNISLEELGNNNLFRTWNGFYLCLNWKKIWYIWILDTEQHKWIKGLWMFTEFII